MIVDDLISSNIIKSTSIDGLLLPGGENERHMSNLKAAEQILTGEGHLLRVLAVLRFHSDGRKGQRSLGIAQHTFVALQ